MKVERFTKASIAKLPVPPEKYTLYLDGSVPGFGVRVTSNGARSYFVETRVNGHTRRVTLCACDKLPPDEARNMARQEVGQMAKGIDPAAERVKKRAKSVTLEKAFEDYTANKDLKPITKNDMSACLKWAFEDWRKTPLAKITRDKVERRYLQLVEKSKARANLSFRYLRAVLNLAAAHNRDADDNPILPSNPVKVLSESRLWRKVPRRRTVLSPEDLAAWVPSVQALGEIPEREPGTGKENPKLKNGEVFRDLFLFLALTGCRKGEALQLRKEDVDLNRGLLVFRDTKNRTDHELPITAALNELLERRTKAVKSPWVFASPHDGRPVSNIRHALARVIKAAGVVFTPHDLRRLAATSMERLGVPTYTVKAILNHLTGASDVTGGYVQVDREMKLAALEKLSRFILANTKIRDNVVNLDSRRAA